MLTAIDCEGFAGGFTLAMVRSGFKLVGKREHPAGFGAALCEGNRHLLGDDWDLECCHPADWTARYADVVFGNPPCSAFSTVTDPRHRGVDSHINQCMWEYAAYVAKCKPIISAMESVALAYAQGRELMQALRAHVEELSGFKYDLYHVLHSAGACGGASIRKRYFMILVRQGVPFGVERPGPNKIPISTDIFGDLSSVTPTEPGESIIHNEEPMTAYQTRARSKIQSDGSPIVDTDGHYLQDVALTRRMKILMESVKWHPGENIERVLCRAIDNGHQPLDMGFGLRDLVNSIAFADGAGGGASRFAPFKIKPDGCCPTVTGGALTLLIHPTQDRTLTYREVARIQGFPDDWTCSPCVGKKSSCLWWGKGITVQAGEWIGKWIRNSIEGTPGSDRGQLMENDREYYINHTEDFIKPLTKDYFYNEE